MEIVTSQLKTLRKKAVKNPSSATIADPADDENDPLKGFGSAAHRKRVEEAAVNAVTAYYESAGYTVTSRERDNIGYDLDVTKDGGKPRHVEVKGTASVHPQFFLTSNEFACSEHDQNWSLSLVANALGDEPTITEYSRKKLDKAFAISPIAFRATPLDN